MPNYRVGFVMEQHLGHATYYQNLLSVVEHHPELLPAWVEVTYGQPGGMLERLPLVPRQVRGAIRGALQVRQGLAHQTLDGLFFFSPNPAVFQRARMRRVPTLLSLDVTPRLYDALGADYGHRASGRTLLGWYKHAAVRQMYLRAALIVPWTAWAKRSLIEDYSVPENRIEIIPPGIDLTLWHPRTDRPPAAFPLRLLFVGGDFTRKGGHELLRWFARHGRAYCTLHIVTKQAIPSIEGVTVYSDLAANTERLRMLYREADLFVLPSRGECFGLAYLEALASGLPVIATTIGGTADIVEDGVNGFRVEPRDEPLSRALQVFIDHPELCRSMGMAGRAVAEQRFDLRANADRLLGALCMAIDRWRAQGGAARHAGGGQQ